MSHPFVVNILNLLVTSISISVALPGINEKDLRLMTLTFLVLFMSKFVNSLNSYDKELKLIYRFPVLIESIIDVIAVSFCFHYLFVVLSTSDSSISVVDYSLFSDKFYLYMIIVVSAIHVLIDLLKCMVSFAKGYRTNKMVFNLTE